MESAYAERVPWCPGPKWGALRTVLRQERASARERRWWRQGRNRVRVEECTRRRASCSTCSGRLPVIMQVSSSAVLYRFSYDVGVVPDLQFIDRVFLPRC